MPPQRTPRGNPVAPPPHMTALAPVRAPKKKKKPQIHGRMGAPTVTRDRPQVVRQPSAAGLHIPGRMGARTPLHRDVPEITPVPRVLSDNGIGSLETFNGRIHDAMQAHRSAFGYDPSPGLMWDLVRMDTDYTKMFDAARKVVRTPSAAGTGPQPRGRMADTYEPPITGTGQAGVGARGLVTDRQFGPTSSGHDIPVVFNQRTGPRPYIGETGGGIGAMLASIDDAVTAALSWGLPDDVRQSSWFDAGVVRKVPGDIINQFRQLPFGVLQITMDVSGDLNDLANYIRTGGQTPIPTFARTRHLAAEMGKSLAEDFAHPSEHPGNFVTDVFGILTAGWGAYGRVGAATAAARTGGWEAGVVAAAKRPLTGTYELGAGAYVVDVPLFENQFLNWLTEGRRAARQEGLASRIGGADYAAKTVPAMVRLYSRYFSPESKLRRRKTADRMLDAKIAMVRPNMMGREVAAQARANAMRDGVFRHPAALANYRALSKRWKAVIDKALDLYHLPVRDPFETMTNAHLAAIDRLRADLDWLTDPAVVREHNRAIAAHTTEMNLIEEARAWTYENPGPAEALRNRARDVSNQQEARKKILMGWDEEMMANHLFEEAAFYDGKFTYTYRPVTETGVEVGMRVRALDRNNTGKVIALDLEQGTATVAFYNNQTKLRAEVELPLEDLANAKTSRSITPTEEFGGTLNVEGSVLPFEVEPYYVPTRSDLAAPRSPAFGGARGAGQFGLGPVSPDTAWLHRFTGSAFETATRRYDTGDLLIEEAAKVAKIGGHLDRHQQIWAIARDEPAGIPADWRQAVRDITTLSDADKRLINLVEQEKIKHGSLDRVSDKMIDDIMRKLLPTDADVAKLTPSEHVKWTDLRMVEGLSGIVGDTKWKWFDEIMSSSLSPLTWINEAGRLFYLFGRLAYGINFLGQGALALIHQGPGAFGTLLKSTQAKKLGGDEWDGLLDAGAGISTSKTGSFLTEKTRATATSQFLATQWSKFTDNHWRRGALIHELERRGVGGAQAVISPEEFAKLVLDGDAKATKTFRVAVDKAQKAMVKYDNLNNMEKATLRHIFFVYAWVSRSAVFSVYWMGEHPIQHMVFNKAGENLDAEIERLNGKVPDWFRQEGWIPIHKGFAEHPYQFNTPNSIFEMAYPLSTIVQGRKYASILDMLSPAAKLAYDVISTSDQGEAGYKALAAELLQTPYGLAATASAGETAAAEAALPSIPIVPDRISTDPSSPNTILNQAVARERAGADEKTFMADGFWGRFGGLIGSTQITGREINELAARGKYWRDMREKDPEAYVEHQRQMAMAMIHRQEKFVGTKAGAAVYEGMNLLADIDKGLERLAQQTGIDGGVSEMNDRTKALVTINVMRNTGRISKQEREQLIQELRSTKADDVRDFRLGLVDAHGGDKLREWLLQVQQVNDIAGPTFRATVERMPQMRLGSYPAAARAPQESRRKYGTRLLEFERQLDQFTDGLDMNNAADRAAYNRWVNEHDKPITIDGVQFPSVVRTTWARQSDEDRQQALADAANSDWQDVKPLEREILQGRRTRQSVYAGWQALETAKDEARKQYHLGRITADYERKLASYVGRSHPGFMQDYILAREAPYVRFQRLSVYRDSKNKARWDEILADAKVYAGYLRQAKEGRADYTMTEVRASWKAYVAELIPYYHDNYEGFYGELRRFGQDGESFLGSLIG